MTRPPPGGSRGPQASRLPPAATRHLSLPKTGQSEVACKLHAIDEQAVISNILDYRFNIEA